MKIEKAHNPFIELYEGYHCFGCSKRNDKGLKLEFFRHERAVFAAWTPDHDLQSYHNILHGGIQATMLDEAGAWWVYLIAGTSGLTSRLSVRYHKSVSILHGDIYLRGVEISKRRNLYTIRAELFSHEMELCARGELEYFTYPVEKAMKEMYFPGPESFKGEMVESADYGFPDALFSALA